jgi:hypothetical protein
VLHWLLAQQASPDVSALGPYAAISAPLLAVIGYLLKALSDARNDTKEARADNRVLVDRVFTVAENSGPILASVKDALERNTRALDRITPDRDR